MFDINVQSNVREVSQWLTDAERRQVPFATALALTRTGQIVKDEEVLTMRRIFDAPTPYTLNALALKPAKKRDLIADVRFKDFASLPAKRYLNPHVYGGGRSKKRSERALEAAGLLRGGEFTAIGRTATKDRFGNISGGKMSQMLSAVRASRDPHQNRGKGKASKYFVPGPNSRLPRAVYERFGKGQIRPFLVFTRPPQYRKRFDFYGIANRIVEQRFKRQFLRAFVEAMRTARKV